MASCNRAPRAPERPEFSEAPSTGNVRVSRDGLALHAEPNLAVNPRDSGNLLGACIADGEAGPVIAAYASFDGGASWRSLGALPDSRNGATHRHVRCRRPRIHLRQRRQRAPVAHR
jgi:hypothetical protein